MNTTQQTAPYRYTPGNGRRYEWDGGPFITIVEIFHGWDESGKEYRSERTLPDVIPAPVVAGAPAGPTPGGVTYARTAEALMATVDTWLAEHPS
jgi:hypothetical protein